MTPEEKAVIEAAIAERNTLGRLLDTSPITRAVDALLRKQAFLSDGETAIIRERSSGDLKQWPASDCLNCDPLLAGASTTRVDGTGAGEAPRHCGHDLDWMSATFADLLPGDLVSLNGSMATVTRVHRGQWHAKDRQWIDDAGKVRDHMTPWEHEELRIDLTANPGMHVYPPDTACEILADAERAAILALQAGFSGAKPVDK